ncbi:hypothetical protein FRC04_006238 [Tulasnella sp. 424]|nr:hypothetical protein FRC04_006238 [Tulasnella sp. 424]
MATPTVGTRKDAPPFELPDIPKEFGQDNGEFYSCYDALAEKLDNNLVEKLKEQLDGHLIFAGLFAGVNSTFLALTLPLLSADPADETNALLRENNAILLQLALNRNDSFPTAKAIPSETFSGSGRVLTVNILFSISLTFALMSSLFAVLGRQWIVEYRSYSGSGVDDHRRERMNRHRGAGRWRLVWLLEDMIPTLLQIGLILFGISLTIYLSTLDPTLTKVVGAFMGTRIGFLACSAIFTLWDPFCPFQTPLSRVITLFTRAAFRATTCLIGLAVLTAVSLIAIPLAAVGFLVLWVGWVINIVLVERRQWTLELQRKALFSSFESFKQSGELWYHVIRRVPRHSQLSPKGVTPTTLEVEAVRRVIRNSKDSATLLTCVTNILAIQNHQVLRRLSLDSQFCNSLIQLCRTAYVEVLRLQGQDWADLATAVTWRYRAAIAHIGLCGVPVNFIFPTGMNRSIGIDDEPGVSIPSNLIKASTPVQINGYLAYAVVFAW